MAARTVSERTQRMCTFHVLSQHFSRSMSETKMRQLFVLCRWIARPATLCVCVCVCKLLSFTKHAKQTLRRTANHWRKLKFDSNANSIKGFERDATHIKIFCCHLHRLAAYLSLSLLFVALSSLALIFLTIALLLPLHEQSVPGIWSEDATKVEPLYSTMRCARVQCTSICKPATTENPVWHNMSFGLYFTIQFALIPSICTLCTTSFTMTACIIKT